MSSSCKCISNTQYHLKQCLRFVMECPDCREPTTNHRLVMGIQFERCNKCNQDFMGGVVEIEEEKGK